MFKIFKKKNKQKPKIIMIAAIQNDRGIGYKGKLIHRISDDMEHFKQTTTNHTIIMGRKCIAEKYLPLPNRQNIIISRNKNLVPPKGVLLAHSITEAIAKSTNNIIYIIGGAQIYNLGMQYADALDITQINADKAANVFFPEFQDSFELNTSSKIFHDEKTGLDYQFQTWKRK